MSNDFKCPYCQDEHNVNDLELWEVFEEDGKETEIECQSCEREFIVVSHATWRFEGVKDEWSDEVED